MITDQELDKSMRYFSEGVTDNTTKETNFVWQQYCEAFSKQIVYRDEACKHSKTIIVSHQNRSADEMESISTTCLLCGKITRK